MSRPTFARCHHGTAGLLLAGILILCSSPAGAADPPKTDVQFWTPVIFQAELNHRWSLQAETQVKVVDDVHEVQNSLLRPAVMFKAGKRTTLTFGYAWIPFFYPARANEHRLWQQAVVSVTRGRWTFLPRVRFEQRFVPVVDRVSFRLRGRFKATHPLSGGGAWQLSLSDEVFLNLNDVVPAPGQGFAGNRAQVGVTRRLSRHLSVEPGYLFQYVHRPGPAREEIDHVVMLTTVVRY